MIYRLKGHESSQCRVEVSNIHNVIEFVSYRTVVIKCVYSKADRSFAIMCTGTYSPTTRRQIGWFLKEYFPSLNYYDMKRIAETGECLDARIDSAHEDIFDDEGW